MNKCRKAVLNSIMQHKIKRKSEECIAICVCVGFLCDEEMADFDEIIAVVDKDWLLKTMKDEGIIDPISYLKEEYISDDSYNWFNDAIQENKIVKVYFN